MVLKGDTRLLGDPLPFPAQSQSNHISIGTAGDWQDLVPRHTLTTVFYSAIRT